MPVATEATMCAERARLLDLSGLALEDRRREFAGVDTAWLEGGDPRGPRVVLLHGALSSGLSWLPILAPLLDGFRVLVPDLPGYGASARPRVTYDRRYYATWCAAYLGAITSGPVALVGNSLGGAIAAQTALDRPDRISRLCLVDPVAVGPAHRPSTRYALAVLRAAAAPRRIGPDLVARLWEGIAAPGTPMTPLLEGIGELGLRGLQLPRGTRAFWHGQRDVVRPFSDEELGRLSVPTLLVWGAADTVTPPAAGEVAATVIPGARLVVVPGAGHAPFLDQPALVADALVAHLTE